MSSRIWYGGTTMSGLITPGVGKGAEIRHIGCGQDEPHAGHSAHCRKVTEREPRMRMRRAHHDRMERTGRRVIGDVVAAAAQQRVVLFAPNRRADTKFRVRCHYALLDALFGLAVRFAASRRDAIARDTT